MAGQHHERRHTQCPTVRGLVKTYGDFNAVESIDISPITGWTLNAPLT